MTDDIVTRLRAELPCWCDAKPTRIEVRDTCWEAAAEIERLHALLERAYRLAVGHGPDFTVFADWEDAIATYEEARRD